MKFSTPVEAVGLNGNKKKVAPMAPLIFKRELYTLGVIESEQLVFPYFFDVLTFLGNNL